MTVKELVDNYSQAYQQFKKAKEDMEEAEAWKKKAE